MKTYTAFSERTNFFSEKKSVIVKEDMNQQPKKEKKNNIKCFKTSA